MQNGEWTLSDSKDTIVCCGIQTEYFNKLWFISDLWSTFIEHGWICKAYVLVSCKVMES